MDYKAKIKELEEKYEELSKKSDEAYTDACKKFDLYSHEDFEKASPDIIQAVIELTDEDPRTKEFFDNREQINELIAIYELCDKYDISEEDAKVCLDCRKSIFNFGSNLAVSSQPIEKVMQRTKEFVEHLIPSLTSVQKRAICGELETLKTHPAFTRSTEKFHSEYAQKLFAYAQESLENSMLPKNEGTGKNDGEGK